MYLNKDGTRASRPKAIITWQDDFTRVVAHPVFVDEADRTGRNFWGDNGAVNVLPNTLAPKIEEGKPFDNPAFLTPSSTSPFALKMLNPQLNQHCGHWLDKLIEKDHLFKDTAQKELPINVANDDMAPAPGGLQDASSKAIKEDSRYKTKAVIREHIKEHVLYNESSENTLMRKHDHCALIQVSGE